MSKRELIDAILEHNRTAAPEFLARFGENDLKAYLERVTVIDDANHRSAVRTTVDAHQELQMA